MNHFEFHNYTDVSELAWRKVSKIDLGQSMFVEEGGKLKNIQQSSKKNLNFDDFAFVQIQLAVLTGRCPVSKVGDVMICASGNEDATACCAAFGVLESGYEHCRPYCNPSAGLPDSSMLAEKYRCLSKLTQIQRCFYLSQREQPR